ncbi:MAG: heme-binding protein [Gammaproteobacteria bacterium]|nr:heme-binding protein [Gammaproteobacteria bacterium]
MGKRALGSVLLYTAIAFGGESMAYQITFEKTAVDEIEVRTLPAARWLTTEMNGVYFDQSNELFMRLFDYIRANDVSMTVPVVSRLDKAEMHFYISKDTPPHTLHNTAAVRLVDVPERQVVSIDGRGFYSEANLTDAEADLLAWLDTQTEWIAAGAPYAVYWNGPFTPWFMKRFEVHLPVEPAN